MSTSVQLHSCIYSSSANMSSSMSRAGHGARHWGTAPASPLWSLWPQRFRPMNDEHHERGGPVGARSEHLSKPSCPLPHPRKECSLIHTTVLQGLAADITCPETCPCCLCPSAHLWTGLDGRMEPTPLIQSKKTSMQHALPQGEKGPHHWQGLW